MKKFFINFGLAAIAILFSLVSCQKTQPEQKPDPVQPEEPQEEEVYPMTFTATGENVQSADDTTSTEQTKVYFENLAENKYTQKWTVGDKIAVYSGTSSTKNEFSVTKIDASGNAIFEGSASGSPYRAMYPSSAASGISDNVITATLPSEQTMSQADGFKGTDPAALISVAYTTDANTLQFYNVFGLIQFALTETDVTAIIIEGNNGENLAGTFTVNTNSTTPTYTVTEGVTNIVLTPPSGSTTFATGTYAAAVFPQEFSKGVKIIYKHSDNAKCSIKTINASTGMTISRSKSRYYSHDKLAPGTYKYYYIMNKADLDAWNNDNGNWSADDVVYLGADIDYEATSNTWVEHDLLGTFNGRNHKISKLGSPLFNEIYGPVKNLKLESDVTISEAFGEEWGYGMLGHYAFNSSKASEKATIENVTTRGSIKLDINTDAGHRVGLGGILGAVNGCPMTDCANYATVTSDRVTIGSVDDGQLRIGGVVGQTQTNTGANLTRCKNYGDISVTGNTSVVKPLLVGGVTGIVTQNVTLSDCDNSGDISVAANSTVTDQVNISGIAAYATSVHTLTGCDNTGNISNSRSSKDYIRVGGICASVSGSLAVTVTSCTNGSSANTNGNITNSGESAYVYLGGIYAHSYGATLTECTNNGFVTNSGQATAGTNFGLRMAGLVGYAQGNNTIGNTDADKCINNGNVTEQSSSLQVGVGGVVGHTASAGSNLQHCVNNGTVSCTGNTPRSAVRIGGIVGSNHQPCNMDHTVNNGTVTFGSTSTTANVGGICGWNQAAASIQSASSSSSATIQSSGNATTLNIGGIVGGSDNNPTIDSQNYSAVSVTGGTIGTLNCAGILGSNIDNPTIKNTNSGNITIESSPSITTLNVAGIVGSITGSVPYTIEANNAGSVTNNNKAATINISGGVGFLSSNPTSFSLTNSGSISNSTSSQGGNHILNIGGVIGQINSSATISTSLEGINKGSVSNSMNTGTSPINIGGVCGLVATEVSSFDAENTNDNSHTISNSASSDANIFIGGLFGNVEALCNIINGSANKGSVSNTGGSAEIAVGGGVGRYSSPATTKAAWVIANSGAISNTGNATASLCMGGILGYNSTGVNFGDGSSNRSSSSGNITNNSTSSIATANIGGLLGEARAYAGLLYSSNRVTGGTIENKSDVTDLSIGGILGKLTNTGENMWNYCRAGNDVTVKNSGTATNLYMGGFVGNHAFSSESIVINYYKANNSASLINTGDVGKAVIGGVVGNISSATNILFGHNASGEHATNNGNITFEGSSSGDCQIGGIVGWDIFSEGNYCDNTGNITVTGNVGGSLYCGGVFGFAAAATSYCTNTGSITVTNVKTGSQFFVGGVIGSCKKLDSGSRTHTYLNNSGAISMTGMTTDTSTGTYHFLGGVSGNSNMGNKFTYCTNSGTVNYSGANYMRIGGIVAYTSANPANSLNTGDITSYCSIEKRCEVGGIVGYFNNDISYVSSIANIKTNGSSYGAFCGGIVGRSVASDSQTRTFSNCTVGGEIWGTNSGNYMAGIFTCNNQANTTYNFTNCIIKKGTKRKATSSITINAISDLTAEAAVGFKSKTFTCNFSGCTVE